MEQIRGAFEKYWDNTASGKPNNLVVIVNGQKVYVSDKNKELEHKCDAVKAGQHVVVGIIRNGRFVNYGGEFQAIESNPTLAQSAKTAEQQRDDELKTLESFDKEITSKVNGYFTILQRVCHRAKDLDEQGVIKLPADQLVDIATTLSIGMDRQSKVR